MCRKCRLSAGLEQGYLPGCHSHPQQILSLFALPSFLPTTISPLQQFNHRGIISLAIPYISSSHLTSLSDVALFANSSIEQRASRSTEKTTTMHASMPAAIWMDDVLTSELIFNTGRSRAHLPAPKSARPVAPPVTAHVAAAH